MKILHPAISHINCDENISKDTVDALNQMVECALNQFKIMKPTLYKCQALECHKEVPLQDFNFETDMCDDCSEKEFFPNLGKSGFTQI